jgi:UDP-2,3-diacylglucosamine hydrolase
MEKIGLIAGNRKFPILFSRAARQKGASIVAVAVKGETSRQLKNYVDSLYWISLADFKKMFEIFKENGIKKVVMAGQISPRQLFSRFVQNNADIQKLLQSIKDRKANTIFAAIAKELEGHGLSLINSTTFIEEYLPKSGVLTKRQPTEAQREDIIFGMGIAKAVADLDIGLSVAVKSKAVVAVEALEGTDNLIKRAGFISRGGFSLIKVGRPDQDMRFDIPVVGLGTVKALVSAKAGCLAIEAGKTLFIDMPEAVEVADKKGLSIVAV